jgi:hypothetical protein
VLEEAKGQLKPDRDIPGFPLRIWDPDWRVASDNRPQNPKEWVEEETKGGKTSRKRFHEREMRAQFSKKQRKEKRKINENQHVGNPTNILTENIVNRVSCRLTNIWCDEWRDPCA